MKWTTTALPFLSLLISSCATVPPAPPKTYAAKPDRVIEAILALHPKSDVRDLEVTTEWIEVSAERQMGWLLDTHYLQRVRYRVELEAVDVGSIVRVQATIEQRAPGGPRSRRWERIRSDGRPERDFYESIERHFQGYPSELDALRTLFPGSDYEKFEIEAHPVFRAEQGIAIRVDDVLVGIANGAVVGTVVLDGRPDVEAARAKALALVNP